MLERDKCTAPAVDGSRLPGVEKEGTDLQRGGKVSGFCFKEGSRFQALIGSYILMALA